MDNFIDELKETAIAAARLGGRILQEGFGTLTSDQIGLKGVGDYITDLDHRSEQRIIQEIRKKFPDHTIQAEESGEVKTGSPFRWIIDPLDGTTNYVQGIPIYSVSIAVTENDQTRMGVVYYPDQDELFCASKGKGAFLNGQRIQCSKKISLEGAILSTGFPWRSKYAVTSYLNAFKEIFLKVDGMRRMGSAAIDLCYTACGRYDGFWEMKLKPWDIAAGILILQEAGGRVSDFIGRDDFFKSGDVVAANPQIHAELTAITSIYLSEVHKNIPGE